MTPKEYLKQVYFLTQMIESEKDEMQMIQLTRDGLSGMGFDPDSVKNGNIPVSAIETGYLKLEYLSEKIKREQELLSALRDEVNDVLSGLKNEHEKEILFMRYLQFLEWSEIHEYYSLIGFTYDSIYAYHRRGLNHIKIPKDSRFSRKTFDMTVKK